MTDPTPSLPHPVEGREPDGTELAPAEILARAVVASRWFNKQTKALKPEAFEPGRDGTLSVTRHDALTPEQLWERCRSALVNQPPNRSLYGRADFSVASVVKSGPGMSAVAAWREHNPQHAHVIGWPHDVSSRLDVQIALAAAAAFVPIESR